MSESQNKHDATRLPDASPPEGLRGLVEDYPGLAIVAGIGVGVLVAALLPRNAGRKLAKGSAVLATAATELGLALGKQALEKAGEGRELLGDKASDAGRVAGDAGRKAAAAARDAGTSAQRLAEDASNTARDLGLALARKAVDAASRLRH